MKLDVRRLCSMLPTYFSRFYSEHAFSDEMRLIRPLLEVKGEEVEGDINSAIRDEFYALIERLLEREDYRRVKDVLRKYAEWVVGQLESVGVER